MLHFNFMWLQNNKNANLNYKVLVFLQIGKNQSLKGTVSQVVGKQALCLWVGI